MVIKEAVRRPLALKNTIQEYLWGSHTAIQQLMGVPKTGAPWAELWMGTHPKAPSQIKIDGKWMGLDALIRQFPDEILGPPTAAKFNGALPFLFKILAAQHPLSIQAHPDKTRAAAGFVRETASGIALDDPARNYRDPSHKPECICALTPFTALKSFRDTDDITGILKRLCPDGIASLIPDAPAGDLKGLGYKHEKPAAPFIRHLYVSLLCLPPDQKKRIIAETLENARLDAAKDPVCAWILRLYQYYPEDIGILGPALMNLVTLTPGQALFLESGELHAYLYGMGIEIMANSDNVLRAGLTVKHVDTEELLDAARFDPCPVEILAPQTVAPHESRYLVHAEEFVLSKIALKHKTVYAAPEDRSVEILLCTGGTARLTHPELADEMILKPGDSVIIPAQADPYHLSGKASIYKAGAPI
ncbi:MAG: mannose-6-phosphate isomerase, class I [Desulfobacteraceae bacterium]|jgi:mannose-6-phosphate isomerase|nr:MAG: mannose-6-phosphate isomerase, class I [Desulfobacteraceae bacterium]